MKSIKLVWGLMLLLTISAAASNKASQKEVTSCLSGIVTDVKTGEKLAGVEVAIEGTKLKTYTNFDGEFAINGLKPGDYKVKTKYISYNTSDLKTITVANNEVHKLTVQLESQAKDAPVKVIAKKSKDIQLATK